MELAESVLARQHIFHLLLCYITESQATSLQLQITEIIVLQNDNIIFPCVS